MLVIVGMWSISMETIWKYFFMKKQVGEMEKNDCSHNDSSRLQDLLYAIIHILTIRKIFIELHLQEYNAW
jgi:hypothetical protein